MTLCFLQSAHSNRGAGVKAAPTKEKFHGVTELLRQLDGVIELRLKERDVWGEGNRISIEQEAESGLS